MQYYSGCTAGCQQPCSASFHQGATPPYTETSIHVLSICTARQHNCLVSLQEVPLKFAGFFPLVISRPTRPLSGCFGPYNTTLGSGPKASSGYYGSWMCLWLRPTWTMYLFSGVSTLHTMHNYLCQFFILIWPSVHLANPMLKVFLLITDSERLNWSNAKYFDLNFFARLRSSAYLLLCWCSSGHETMREHFTLPGTIICANFSFTRQYIWRWEHNPFNVWNIFYFCCSLRYFCFYITRYSIKQVTY